jgi:hypothetical protein
MRAELIMDRGDGYDEYLSWPKELREANTQFMRAFGRSLGAQRVKRG